MTHRDTIAVGQRLIRWDGEPGHVALNSLGKRLYTSTEEFCIHWNDGECEYLSLAAMEEEGVRFGRGRMAWAR